MDSECSSCCTAFKVDVLLDVLEDIVLARSQGVDYGALTKGTPSPTLNLVAAPH
jgi:hypothetical protein